MQRDALTRKNRTLNYIRDIKNLPIRQRSHEQMCSCYVYTFGALEFMLETITRSWIQSNIKKHKIPYRGKSSVDRVIGSLESLAEYNLEKNHKMDYEAACDLVQKLAGREKRDELKLRVGQAPGGVNSIITAIKRIQTTRHIVAHGKVWPNETSPNLDELESDFILIYEYLIKPMNEVLRRY